jgi:hypothetical protein
MNNDRRNLIAKLIARIERDREDDYSHDVRSILADEQAELDALTKEQVEAMGGSIDYDSRRCSPALSSLTDALGFALHHLEHLCTDDAEALILSLQYAASQPDRGFTTPRYNGVNPRMIADLAIAATSQAASILSRAVGARLAIAEATTIVVGYVNIAADDKMGLLEGAVAEINGRFEIGANMRWPSTSFAPA